jgi:hypothetical protein
MTGTSSTLFAEVIDAIISVHSGFTHHLHEDALLPWTSSMFEEHDSIDISNRYFAPRHYINPQTVIPFTAHVDPYGALQKLQGSDLVHTTDNQVEYYEHVMNSNRTKRQIKIIQTSDSC